VARRRAGDLVTARIRRAWGNLLPFGQRLAGVVLGVSLVLAAWGLSAMCARDVAPPAATPAPIVQPVEWAQLFRSSAVEGASGMDAPGASSTAFELARFVATTEVGDESSSAPLTSAAPVAEVAATTEESSPVAPVPTAGERAEAFALALASSPWPEHLWADVTAIAWCESRFKPHAVGDRGRSFGALQVHAPAHPHLMDAYDLLDLSDNLAAGWEVYVEAGHSFRPWSCYR
jgi:hypothetical protein